MAIDPSIPLQAQAPAYNPLAQVGQFAQTGNALIGYQQAQQEMAGRQAIGNALAQATGPDGTLDQGKFRSLAAADPNARYVLQEADSTSLAQQGTGISNNDHALAYQQHAQAAIGSVLSSVASNPTPVNLAAATTLAHRLYPDQTDTINGVVQGIISDPGGIGTGVKGVINRMQSAAGQQENWYGTAGSINNGRNVVSGTVRSPMQGGGFVPSTATPLGVGPETAARQEQGTDANGIPYATTLGNRLNSEGAGDLVNPGGTTSTNAQGKPTIPSAWNTGGGRYTPPAAAPSPVGPSGSPPASSPSAPGTVPTGPSPGQVAAIGAPVVAGADAANNLMSSASGSPERKALLGSMLNDLTSFRSGPGADTFRNVASRVNNVFGTSIDADGIEASQSFNKLGQQIAQQQAIALGAGTHEKLASSVAANPNSHLQTNTNTQILHVLQGNEDAINAKANAWQSYLKTGGKPGDFQSWNQTFNSTFDPRAFQLLRMSQEERTAFQQQLAKSGQLDAFKASVNAMGKSGLLPMPAPPGGAPASGN